jgi:hypothetical protein
MRSKEAKLLKNVVKQNALIPEKDEIKTIIKDEVNKRIDAICGSIDVELMVRKRLDDKLSAELSSAARRVNDAIKSEIGELVKKEIMQKIVIDVSMASELELD